jgi:hypothetical protein
MYEYTTENQSGLLTVSGLNDLLEIIRRDEWEKPLPLVQARCDPAALFEQD